MMVKTRELIGDQLDWAVATCEGYTNLRKNAHRFDRTLIVTPPRKEYGPVFLDDLDYSGDWAMGGPIIHREGIGVQPSAGLRPVGIAWSAEYSCAQASLKFLQHGPTPLIASMRCFVASKFGDEVDIPEELL